MAEDIAVIGAGVAGLACARALAVAGRRVRVIEKSRGLGGRAACRVSRQAGVAIDHGAPAFSATSPNFAAEVARWVAAGAAAPWAEAGPGAHVGLPGMSGLARPMAEGLEIALETRATGLSGAPGAWHVLRKDGPALGPFAWALLAMPPPQAAALLGAHAARFPDLAHAGLSPSWAVLAAFDAPLEAPSWQEGDGEPLALAVRDGAKPGRNAGETWALHAGAAWSEAHLEARPEAVEAALLEAFAAVCGRPLPPARYRTAHRWRYARATAPLSRPCLLAPDLRLGLAGDWCPPPPLAGIEAAWTSGRALAAAVLA